MWTRRLYSFFAFSLVWGFSASYKSKAHRQLDSIFRDFFPKLHLSRNDTIFQIKEFEAYNLTYNLLVTNFHKNGVIESTGQLHDYWRKSGEWLFYNNNGVLVKKEYWEWPSGWYNSHKTKTTFFNTDGSIDKTIKQ